MARITFDKIMAHHPGHNKDTYDDLKESYKNGRIVPFVGAGLSVFCGYLQWKDLLKEFLSYVEASKQAEITELIEKGAYLAAAGKIQEAYAPILIPLKKRIPYSKIEKCGEVELQNSVAYLLPMLFPQSPYVTTNFDRVLEYVNLRHGKKFDYILYPDDVAQLTQTHQQSRHDLFKLHGDIGQQGMTENKIVFTEQQYDDAYINRQEIKDILLNWFRNSVMLFLGCSLTKDRTLDLLQEARKSSQQGTDHFAILPSKDHGEGCERLNELYTQYGIRPIFYPEGQHDSVQVILERLLEETNQEVYQTLIHSRPRERTISEGERFEYNAETVSFVGRMEEMAALQEFCNSDPNICWWAITGQGGTGKSRLAYEFKKELEKSDWSVKWLEQYGYSDLVHYEPTVDKTLVICDDVQAHMDELCDWMHRQLRKHRSQPLRILLIEREGKSGDSVTWRKLLDDDSMDALERKCHKEQFLELKPLDDASLMELMEDFARSLGKTLDREAQMDLLKVLHKMDKEYQRPLYALAIADARCSGEKPENWSQPKVLQWLVKREKVYYHNKLKEIAEGVKIQGKHKDELDRLIAHSCIGGFIPLDKLSSYPTPQLDAVAQCAGMELSELLSNLGLVRSMELTVKKFGEDDEEGTAVTQDTEVLAFHCPDILKEYFALELSLEHRGWGELFEDRKWTESPMHIMFLSRSVWNHSRYLREKTVFFKTVFAAEPESLLCRFFYAWLVFSIAGSFKDKRQEAVLRLKKLHLDQTKDPNVAYVYACALVNLTTEQDLAGTEKTVAELKTLYEGYSSNEEIAVQYARGLYNLTVYQDLAGMEKTVAELKTLYEAPSSNEEIAVQYARGLYNLTVYQDLAGMEKTVAELKTLYEAPSSNEEIAVQYARGLYNLTVYQDLAGMEKTVAELKILYEGHSSNEEIAVQYAKGLRNLSVDQDLTGREKTVAELKTLYEGYSSNEEIAVQYARGLYNLTVKQDLAGREKTVAELKTLYEGHSSNEKIAVAYAAGLLILTGEQDLAGREKMVAELKTLYEGYSSNEMIAVAYAAGLLVLTGEQDLAEREKTVAELKTLYEGPSSNEMIAVAYATGLCNLTADQDLAEREKTVAELKTLYEGPSSNEEIVVAYARGLCDLTADQDLAEREKTVAQLKNLYEGHSSNEKIAVEYATGLLVLTGEQDLAGREKTVAELKTLYEGPSSNEEIAVAYAAGLYNLTVKQDLAGMEKTVAELKTLYEEPSSIEEIAVAYAKGLCNLSANQDLAEREKTVDELKSLRERHSSNEKIVAVYGVLYVVEHEDCGLDELPVKVGEKQSTAEAFADNLVNVSLRSKKAAIAKHCGDLTGELLEHYKDSESICLSHAMILFNVTLYEEEGCRGERIEELASYLRSHGKIQAAFRAALDTYLRNHPEHRDRYRCLYM